MKAPRLNNNHWLVKEIAGYLLHPSIPIDRPNLRIADEGTGTAKENWYMIAQSRIWALELATWLTSSPRFDGFDISPGQIPPPSFIPASRHLYAKDAFTIFPPEDCGMFNIVHARFWQCLVNNPDTPVLLENLASLLKPGGYIQWSEPLPLSARTVCANPTLDAPAVDRLTTQGHKPKPTSTYDWVERLPEAFCSRGLEVVAADRIPMFDRYRLFWGHSQLAGLEDVAAGMEMLGVEKAEQLNKWIVQLNHEFRKGASVDTSFTCVVGRSIEEER